MNVAIIVIIIINWLWIGYFVASIIRHLGCERRCRRRLAFFVNMLLWPIALAYLDDIVAQVFADEECDHE